MNPKELETRYLSSCLWHPAALDGETLVPEDLAYGQNAIILTAVLEMRASGETVNPLSVRAYLSEFGETAAIAQVDEIAGVVELDGASLVPHLRRVSQARRLRERAQRAVEACERFEVDRARELMEGASDEFLGAATGIPVSAEDVVASALEVFDSNSSSAVRIFPGLPTLDFRIGYLSSGSLFVVGARPGVGKSSLVLTMALEQESKGHKPGIISVEDPADLWGAKILGWMTGINPSRFRGGKAELSLLERKSMVEAAPKAKDLSLKLSCESNSSVQTVVDSMRRMVRKEGCTIIYVDYLQRIRGRQAESARIMFGEIAGELKDAAQELSVPLVLCSQLKRTDKEVPSISDLKETGSIEEMAEVVVLLWPEDSGGVLGKIAKLKWDEAGQSFNLFRDSRGHLREGDMWQADSS